MNLAQRMTTPDVEAINSHGSGRQPAQRDAEKVEKSLRDMLRVDPGSTWILSMHVEPIYPV